MVKINNKFGDIKIGTQGRTVYQRKNGQQIRRMREPKRAIPSETQIRHRQLYRDALDWRKTLSLANRRSLDGYAIANWIVDDHHIPLPWHRLALKLYLEHVHFTLLSKPTPPTTGDWQKFESQETGDTAQLSIYAASQCAQSFTPQESHTLDRFDVLMFRQGDCPYEGHLTIYLADANHKPTGDPLSDGEFVPNEVPLLTAAWIEITIPETPLAQNVEYVAVLSMSWGGATIRLRWRYQPDANPYPRGIALSSTDYGATWYPYDLHDFMFKEYGTLGGGPGQPGELEIRHPALKNITRKHEGIIAQKWENMSSLDEGRLFDHLKLAADAGDLISATTIADLTSTYQL